MSPISDDETSDSEPARAKPPTQSSSQDDEEFDQLIARARAGDNESLGVLLDRCQGYLLKIANDEIRSDLKGKFGASDAVQETMMDAQAGVAGFDGYSRSQWLAWLRAILRHNLTDIIRSYAQTDKRRVDREQPIGSRQDFAADDSAQTPSRLVGAEEEELRMRTALSKLPQDYQSVIDLRNWQLLSFSEIGIQIGRSEEAARKLWVRAIERLQREMNDEQ